MQIDKHVCKKGQTFLFFAVSNFGNHPFKMRPVFKNFPNILLQCGMLPGVAQNPSFYWRSTVSHGIVQHIEPKVNGDFLVPLIHDVVQLRMDMGLSMVCSLLTWSSCSVVPFSCAILDRINWIKSKVEIDVAHLPRHNSPATSICMTVTSITKHARMVLYCMFVSGLFAAAFYLEDDSLG